MSSDCGSTVYTKKASYLKYGDHATGLVSDLTYRIGEKSVDREKYSYDAEGNISAIHENGKLKVRYTYDSLNRLIREDNSDFKLTTTFAYDNGGNIIRQNEYAFSLAPTDELTDGTELIYEYGDENRPDQLMSFNGKEIAYDANGCPTSYLGNQCSFTRGTLLAKYGAHTFAYDADGIRTKKSNITFTYIDSKLIRQTGGEHGQIDFIYGASGVIGFKHGGTSYFYRRNLMGDVTHIYDMSGNLCAKYVYDAWGNHQIETNINDIATINPIRYRGYYYDTETGLYYLQTRYYDPETGRFISQDDVSYLAPDNLTGLNLYAYCGNDPIRGYDPNGTWDWGTFWRVLGSTLAIAGGIALCFVPGAQAIGAGLIIAGAGGMIGGTISFAQGNGFNYGWDIGTLIGGSIGLAVAAPQLFSLTFNASIPLLAPMLTTAGELVLVGTTVSVAIPIGGAIAVAAGAGLLMFASDHRPKNNQVQNKQFRKAAEEAGFNPKDPYDMDILNEIHQYIRENGLDLGWKKLVELMKQWR